MDGWTDGLMDACMGRCMDEDGGREVCELLEGQEQQLHLTHLYIFSVVHGRYFLNSYGIDE